MLCLVNLVYAGRFTFGVNLCGVDARLLVRSFIERELVPSPRESTRPWRLAEPVYALLSIPHMPPALARALHMTILFARAA